MTECDEVLIVMDTIAAKKDKYYSKKNANTVETNVTSTASVNYHSNIVTNRYILHTVLLVTILLLIIIIIWYYYSTKRYNTKWKIMNFIFVLKIARAIILMT